jgi:hypothetical protein
LKQKCGRIQNLGREAEVNYQNSSYHPLVIDEETKYLHTTFPKAIAIVAEITCKSKLSQPPSVEGEKYLHGKIYMNLFCAGTLDADLVRLLCKNWGSQV